MGLFLLFYFFLLNKILILSKIFSDLTFAHIPAVHMPCVSLFLFYSFD